MRVFVTGANGWIGSAAVRELLGNGHEVTGLARTEQAQASLQAIGAKTVRGDLSQLALLHEAASKADGVLHFAFHQDFTDIKGSVETNRQSIETLGKALASTHRPLIVAFATMGLTAGKLGDEDAAADLHSVGGLRVMLEEATLALASQGVRACAVRLAPTVHGKGDHGLVPQLIQIAREKGVSAYLGDGMNRWPAVHRLDAAHLFCLALEKAPAGSKWHAVAEEGISFRTIATIIGEHLQIPVVRLSMEEAALHFGWLAPFVANDNPVSSQKTKERLLWQPFHPTLLADLQEGHYFHEAIR